MLSIALPIILVSQLSNVIQILHSRKPAVRKPQRRASLAAERADRGRHVTMRIAIIVETFARDMGYLNNTLPKYLTRLGHEVHVISTDLSPYHQIGAAASVFGEDFSKLNCSRAGMREELDGYTVHILAQKRVFGYPRPVGLEGVLALLRPDIVYSIAASGWIPLQCALLRRRLGYRLMIGSHMGKTVFQLPRSVFSLHRIRNLVLRKVPGWYISARAELCVVPTTDCAEVVTAQFGVPSRMVRVMNLPVDTDFFYPNPTDAKSGVRQSLRARLGIPEDGVLCVYSGKFTTEKNPVVLAQAVELLRRRGRNVSALFVGFGDQAASIGATAGCIVIPFMPVRQLGDYYRASDIGVWMNESISFLDAACCGLPLLLSDVVKDTSHVREFTRVFRSGSAGSLAHEIEALLDPDERRKLSALAARLGFERFGAARYAARRAEQFKHALG